VGAIMLSDEVMNYMLAKAYRDSIAKTKPPVVKRDISEEEALQIFNEIVELYKSHNVSYQCACRLTMALNHAFLTGAVELYEREMN